MARAQNRTLPDGSVKRIRMSESWQKVFIAHLSLNGNVTVSCELTGISRQTYYQTYAQYPDFAALADDAQVQFVERLEHEVHRRAMAGSDDLLWKLLRANRPEKYRDRSEVQQTITHDYRVEIGSPYVPAQISQDDHSESLRIIHPSEQILE